MNKKHRIILLVVLAILIFVISTNSVATIKATDTRVTRTSSTTNPNTGAILEVTLNITGLQIGGIVETIPDGFTYVGTDYPSNRTSVSDNKVAFAIINTTRLSYRVKALSGRGNFSGIWEDYLKTDCGKVEGMAYASIRGEATPMPSVESLMTPPATLTPTSAPVSPPKSKIPGFEVLFATAVLFAIYFIFKSRRERR